MKSFKRVIATLLVLGQGLYLASTHPGPMDTFNAFMGAWVVWTIWDINKIESGARHGKEKVN